MYNWHYAISVYRNKQLSVVNLLHEREFCSKYEHETVYFIISLYCAYFSYWCYFGVHISSVVYHTKEAVYVD
jgi:hypothetical protein